MRRRVDLHSTCIAFSLGVLMTLIVSRFYSEQSNNIKPTKTDQRTVRNFVKTDDGEKILLQPILRNLYSISRNITIEQILRKTRLKIRRELDSLDYNFTYSGVRKLEDLLIESGGKPLRSVIISTWRSGSSFVGDLLNAMPSNYYHYEPLIYYENTQIRSPPEADKCTNSLRNMLKCDFSGEKIFIKYSRTMNNTPLKYNKRLWNVCKNNKKLCTDADFLTKFCKLFPFQSMKSVRFRLHLVNNILEDNELNVRVVLLIRDPRGVMQSRRRLGFCRWSDCLEPRLLCDDMISDFVAAGQLLQKYPGRLTVLRYEDLVLNLNSSTFHLLEFLRLEPVKSFGKFLYTHTNIKTNNAFSTFRVSREIPFKWKNLMSFNNVEKIQDACYEAMDIWGYEMAHNASHMTSKHFNPLLPYSLTPK